MCAIAMQPHSRIAMGVDGSERQRRRSRRAYPGAANSKATAAKPSSIQKVLPWPRTVCVSRASARP